MSLSRRRAAAEERSLSYQDVWGTGANAGQNYLGTSAQRALTLGPVYAATSMISDMISTVPLIAYDKASDGSWRKQMLNQPQLVTNPNPGTGGLIAWNHQFFASILLHGNGIGYILTRDAANTPTKVVWLNPTDVFMYEDPNTLDHAITFYWRGWELPRQNVIHVPGYVLPGSNIGLSPIELFKLQIETGLSTQEFQKEFYDSGAAPAAHMKNTAMTLEPDDANKIKARVKAAISNRDILVTGNDWEWQALALPNDHVQFLESIRANAAQIAAIFRVSPEDIGGDTGTSTSLTYKTLEQDSIRLNTRALRPWATRLSEALTVLLPGNKYVQFNLDVNAQGTKLERANAAATSLNAGISTLSEERAAEDRPPLTPEELQFWQDTYHATPAVPTFTKTDPNA